METIGWVLAALAGLLHVYIFVLEALRFDDPGTRAVFRIEPEHADAVRPWAWNQGWYNLFLAVGALAGADSATLAQLKKSLRPLQDSPAAAEAAGYEASATCVASPAGGMGYHYVNMSVAMLPADPMRPAVLVYVPGKDGHLTLGAAEWFKVDADQDLSTDSDRPSLFGRSFDGPMLGHEPGMPTHYDLHAWLFQPNPKGVFQPWNPTVSC
jgi:hypothetical protein